MSKRQCNTNGSRGLRSKSLTLLAGSLIIVLGLVAAFIMIRTHSMSTTQTRDALTKLANSIADTAKTFGETGDMDGLAIFLNHIEERSELNEVHLVRGPLVVADIGGREGAEPRDLVENRVLETGEKEEVVDHQAHTIRFVFPTLADEGCTGCHTAEVGDRVRTRRRSSVSILLALVGPQHMYDERIHELPDSMHEYLRAS